MRRLLVLLPLMLMTPFAAAQTYPTCTAISGSGISFGNYTGVVDQPTGTLTITCPAITTYIAYLNAGVGSGGTTTTRTLTGPGGAKLSYRMFQNSSRTTNWGNNELSDAYSGFDSSSSPFNLTIYAQAAAGQTPTPGTYTDTITASMTNNGGIQTSFTVTAIVQATCTVSATTLAFGAYSGSLVKSTSTITATCTSGTPYNVGLNAGTATGATVTTRSMTGPGGALLGYQLFLDSGYTTNWGNTVGTNTEAGTGTGLAQSLTVYGQIPAGESANPGAYSDTIIVTLTY